MNLYNIFGKDKFSILTTDFWISSLYVGKEIYVLSTYGWWDLFDSEKVFFDQDKGSFYYSKGDNLLDTIAPQENKDTSSWSSTSWGIIMWCVRVVDCEIVEMGKPIFVLERFENYTIDEFGYYYDNYGRLIQDNYLNGFFLGMDTLDDLKFIVSVPDAEISYRDIIGGPHSPSLYFSDWDAQNAVREYTNLTCFVCTVDDSTLEIFRWPELVVERALHHTASGTIFSEGVHNFIDSQGANVCSLHDGKIAVVGYSYKEPWVPWALQPNPDSWVGPLLEMRDFKSRYSYDYSTDTIVSDLAYVDDPYVYTDGSTFASGQSFEILQHGPPNGIDMVGAGYAKIAILRVNEDNTLNLVGVPFRVSPRTYIEIASDEVKQVSKDIGLFAFALDNFEGNCVLFKVNDSGFIEKIVRNVTNETAEQWEARYGGHVSHPNFWYNWMNNAPDSPVRIGLLMGTTMPLNEKTIVVGGSWGADTYPISIFKINDDLSMTLTDWVCNKFYDVYKYIIKLNDDEFAVGGPWDGALQVFPEGQDGSFGDYLKSRFAGFLFGIPYSGFLISHHFVKYSLQDFKVKEVRGLGSVSSTVHVSHLNQRFSFEMGQKNHDMTDYAIRPSKRHPEGKMFYADTLAMGEIPFNCFDSQVYNLIPKPGELFRTTVSSPSFDPKTGSPGYVTSRGYFREPYLNVAPEEVFVADDSIRVQPMKKRKNR